MSSRLINGKIKTMKDIFNKYTGTSLGRDPLTVAKRVLAKPRDKGLLELFCFFIAINSQDIDGRKIYKALDKRARAVFIDIYNKAYLLLKVWSRLVSFVTNRRHILPNLYLAKEDGKNLFYLYKDIFGADIRRVERRWKEILNFC